MPGLFLNAKTFETWCLSKIFLMSEPNHLKSTRNRVTFQRCAIGVAGEAGWIVLYGGNIIAILEGDDEGNVSLCAGFEEPYDNIGLSWTNLADAKADFSRIARLYRIGVPPTIIGSAMDYARRLRNE